MLIFELVQVQFGYIGFRFNSVCLISLQFEYKSTFNLYKYQVGSNRVGSIRIRVIIESHSLSFGSSMDQVCLNSGQNHVALFRVTSRVVWVLSFRIGSIILGLLEMEAIVLVEIRNYNNEDNDKRALEEFNLLEEVLCNAEKRNFVY